MSSFLALCACAAGSEHLSLAVMASGALNLDLENPLPRGPGLRKCPAPAPQPPQRPRSSPVLELPRSESKRVAAAAAALVKLHGNQVAAASVIGLNRETLASILRGAASLSVTEETLHRLAEAAGVSVEQLRRDEPASPFLGRPGHAIRRGPARR